MFFSLRERYSLWRCHVVLFCYVMALLFLFAWCYDPCPESLRNSPEARPLDIPDNEVEKAMKEAEEQVKKIVQQENELRARKRYVDKSAKTPESTHPQAHASDESRRLEKKQLQFQKASDILTKKYNLTPGQVACGLPKLSLKDPSSRSAVQECTSNNNNNITCNSGDKYRRADGTCNNLQNPTWGSAGACFNRIYPAEYSNRLVEDGARESKDGGPLPSPRRISLCVHSHLNRPTNYINHLYMFWGQYLDHDITLTTASQMDNEAIQCCPLSPDNHPQCSPIIIENNDPFYSRYNVSCLNFVRSAFCPSCVTGPRTQTNQLTSFIDGSQVYGNSDNETTSLRDPERPCFLRVQITRYGELLPQSPDPQNDQCSDPAANNICFLAGDPRVNQHPNLVSLHTLYVRQHNRVATRFRAMNPQWSNETCFQETRRYVIAEKQAVTYNEYLPITLGADGMTEHKLWLSDRYTAYDSSCDPTLWTEFSTAFFRFGHSTINSHVAEATNDPNHRGHLLRNLFLQPFEIQNDGAMDAYMSGSTKSPAQWMDRYMVPDVTNYLYRTDNNTAGLDLASFNINRGRDHGLRGYTEYVKWCSGGAVVIKSFHDLISKNVMYRETVDALQKCYKYVEDIDAFTGMASEIYSPGAVVGPTARCVIGKQFYKLKCGDRYYFEHGGQAGSLTTAQLREIKKASLAKIICDNTGITKMQPQAMLFPDSRQNPILDCKDIKGPDLAAWKE